MQMYVRVGNKIKKRRFRRKHFVNERKYIELLNNRPRVKELRGLKEAWQNQKEKEKRKKRGGEHL